MASSNTEVNYQQPYWKSTSWTGSSALGKQEVVELLLKVVELLLQVFEPLL